MILVDSPEQLKDKLGTASDCPMVRSVDKAMLEAFTKISMDLSPMHSADTSSSVLPGNLLIALLPAMLQSGLRVKTYDHCKTVTLNKVRFYQSIGMNEPLRLSFELLNVRTRGGNTFVVAELTLNRANDRSKVLSAEQTDCYVA